MALDSKKYGSIHNKTGSDEEKLKAEYDNNKHAELLEFAPEAALMYQLQEITEELDYLRGIINANNDKATFPGFGTSGSTCLAGNTTTISTSQANAITANTAKTGISDSQADAITANTAKVTFPVTYHEALPGSLSFAVDKTGANLTISNTYTEKGKSITKSTTLILK